MSFNWQLLPFDALVALHRTDPQGFEKYRDLHLNRAVAMAPVHQRPALAQTLCDIVAARKSAKSALEAATLAHCMMSKSLCSLGEKLQDLHYAVATLQTQLIIDDLKSGSSASKN